MNMKAMMSEDLLSHWDREYDVIRTESNERQRAFEAMVKSKEECESQMVR